MRKLSIAITLLFTLNLATPVFADTISGINFLNNTNKESDYKLDKDQVKEYKDSVKSNSDIVEVDSTDNGRTLNTSDAKYAYLINHNIVTRENSVFANTDGVNITSYKENLDTSIQRSNFLMGLYKSVYGVIPSRPVLFHTNSKRVVDGEVQNVLSIDDYTPKGTDKKSADGTYDFNGDYQIYVSPNVYELYLSDMLSKGLIKESEIKDSNFLKQYSENGTTVNGKVIHARWSNKLPAYQPFNKQGATAPNECPSSPLGEGWQIRDLDLNKHTVINPFVATTKTPNYFKSEKLITIDALKYIEEFLRINEKDMSDTEANIIAYKYGTEYLLRLDGDDKETMSYLIAMGIVDFENPREFSNLYEPLSKDYAYTLLYRIANKAGRKDFSKIQLTDNESFWMKKGYVENKIKIINGMESRQPTTQSCKLARMNVAEQPIGGLGLMSMFSWLGITAWAEPMDGAPVDYKDDKTKKEVEKKVEEKKEEKKVEDKKEKAKDASKDTSGNLNMYAVTKVFYNVYDYTYNDKIIGELKEGDDGITKIHYVKDDTLQITFNVNAPDSDQAIALVDSRIGYKVGKHDVGQTIQSITQIKHGNKFNTYVPANELNSADSEIVLINDKTLKNKKTGDTAILLQDNNIAMVGNTVIKGDTDEKMLVRINNETYYNLKVIIPLMTNAFISDVDPSKIYVTKDLLKENIVPVYGSGNIIEYCPVVTANNIPEFSGNGALYNENLLTKGVTSLMRDFSVNLNGKSTTVKVIVDWSYSMPKTPPGMSKSLSEDKFSVKNASEFLFTKPEDAELLGWWQDNKGLSNALANFIYGTQDKEYIQSGYLSPSVTLLVGDGNGSEKLDEASAVKQVFSGLTFSQDYSKQFLDGDPNSFIEKLFNGKDKANLNYFRRFNIYQGKETPQATDFSGLYATTLTGAVYRSIPNDPRLSYTNNTITVNTRTEETKDLDFEGKYVKFNGKEFYADGYAGKDGMYLRLVSKYPIKGTAKSVDGGYTVVDSSGDDLLKQFTNNVLDNIDADACMKSPSIKEASRLVPIDDLEDGKYVIEGELKELQNTKKLDVEIKSLDSSELQDVRAFPAIYLKRTNFRLKDGELVAQTNSPFIEQGNIFYSGLNSSMISKLLDDNSKVVSFNKLPDGAKVLISDATFIKRGSSLVSQPIENSALVSHVINAIQLNKDSAMQSAILKYFSGINLDYSRRPLSLTSYIKSASVGTLLEDTKYNDTLYRNGMSYGVMSEDNQPSEYQAGYVPKTVTIQISLDESVNFIPIDNRNDVYTLKYVTNKFSEGYIDDVSMFSETLGLTIQDDLFLSLQRNKFEPMRNAIKYIQQFQQLYKDALKGDARTVLVSVLTWILTYLIVMTWFAFSILYFQVGKNLLLIIRDPIRTSDRRGVDLLKIFSFGVFNLDMDFPPFRLFVGDVLLFLLLYIVLYIL